MKAFRSTLGYGIGLLILLSVFSGGMQAWVSNVDLRSALLLSPVEVAANSAGIPLVRTDQMRRMVDQGTHLVLDARSLSEYDRGHIPGAMPLPLADFENSFPGIAPILSPEDPLVMYCSGPRCDDALLLAQRIKDAGFDRVSVYLDGWEGWSQ